MPCVDLEFTAELWQWRGPAPFYWLTVPEDGCVSLRAEAEAEGASYGWGAVPVCARIGSTTWETSLRPRDGGYVVPVKFAVRSAERVDEGDPVRVALNVARSPGERQLAGPLSIPAHPPGPARRRWACRHARCASWVTVTRMALTRRTGVYLQ